MMKQTTMKTQRACLRLTQNQYQNQAQNESESITMHLLKN